MSEALRKEALRVFKKLHRTRLKVFQGDEHALDAARRRINDEYRKCKNVSDEGAITEFSGKFCDFKNHHQTTFKATEYARSFLDKNTSSKTTVKTTLSVSVPAAYEQLPGRALSQLIKFAEAVETEVRTTVIQAVQKEPGKFELRITEDTLMVNNEVQPGDYIPKGKLKKCSDVSEKKT